MTSGCELFLFVEEHLKAVPHWIRMRISHANAPCVRILPIPYCCEFRTANLSKSFYRVIFPFSILQYKPILEVYQSLLLNNGQIIAWRFNKINIKILWQFKTSSLLHFGLKKCFTLQKDSWIQKRLSYSTFIFLFLIFIVKHQYLKQVLARHFRKPWGHGRSK